MKNFKKLILFTAFALSASLILPAEASKATCWSRFTSCFSAAPQSSAQDLEHARYLASRRVALGRIRALQESAEVAPKKFVRPYKTADFRQAYAVLAENGFDDYYLQSEEHKALVFEECGEIKGVCVSMLATGYIYALSIGNSYKRQGVGSALVYATMYAMKKDYDVNSVSLITRADTKGFYEKLGFEFTDGPAGRRALE